MPTDALLGALAARTMPCWPEVMSQATAAAYLDVSEGTLRRWRRDAGLPFLRLPPTNEGTRGVVRYRRRDLDAWARKHRSTKA